MPVAAEFRPLLTTLRRLASERELGKLLALITDSAVSLSRAERGFVLLVDEAGRLEARTVRGAENQLGKDTAAFSRSIAETVLIDGEPVITVDAAQDARVQDYMSVHQLMLKSVACLPIETRGRTWGVLYLEHRSASGRFSGTDLAMLRAFADQAAIAIETADLFERIEAQKLDLERANEALRGANLQLEERLSNQEEALQRTRREIARLEGSTARGERWGLVGVSERMSRVYEVLDRVCTNDVPVVITGESGTGKELVARAIHRGSARSGAPYVSLSCGAIPEGLLESELFGHVAGAFTGATGARDGVFVQADGGTLFMDEIADMPPRMQLDLLRVLQERRVRPVGSLNERPVDVRVVTAAKRPLRELLDEGQLREDLYYRLAVVEIQLPPLRERRADIPLLCDHFLARIAAERGEPRKRLRRAAVRRLRAHDFPGNVRELEHLLINASVFATGGTIEADDLAIETTRTERISARDTNNYRDFKDAERDRILAALNAHGWNRAQAARSLGMARRTFYRRLKQHRIELPGGSG
jgi:transcriptional regulator with GAF, ATPase, and Fis domain